MKARNQVCNKLKQTIIHLQGSRGHNCTESAKTYGYEVASLIRYLEEHDIED